MALAPGAKLGPYEILAPLGAGGMGEVYRARDTRLDRTVAIKVLPSHLSSDAELKQRFEREAKAISALSHANICTLYDVGSQDGTDFLVMECLEGQTLAERLLRGPLPMAQALTIGVEIAHALQKAHGQGIIHRDLKPGNIMLTKSGAKLMDFGLAKPEFGMATGTKGTLTPSTPTMNLASLTAAAAPLTQKGSILGTFQYMAPESLQGIEADARSDIFAFGCVLYEMVTAQRAFEGKSQLSVLSAILEKDPAPLRSLQPLAPAMLERVVKGCLAKDPADRFQSAHDVAMDLRWIADSLGESAKSVSPLKNSWAAGLAAALVAALAIAGFAGYGWAKFNATPESLHAEILPPEKFAYDATGDAGGMPVLSAQGDKLAFVAHSGEDKFLWVRPLNSDVAQRLEGTRGASHPFWSPDGRYLGFYLNSKISKIAVSGGPISALAEAPNGRGATWGADDTIVFTADYLGELKKVSAQGGAATAATVIDKRKHTTHRWPWFLPDGKHFIFLATSHTGGDAKANGIYFASVDNSEPHFVVATDSAAQFSSGYLLYRLNTALVAQPFDPETGKLSGSPAPLVNNLRDDVGVWRSIFATSQNGLLIYEEGNADAAKTRLVWFDRSGKERATYDTHENSVIDVRLSPDDKRVAMITGSPNSGVWTLDLERNTKARITFDPQAVREPSWSPDGKKLLFAVEAAKGGGEVELRTKASDGSGAEETVSREQNIYSDPAWSPDGKYLAYLLNSGHQASLWIAPVQGNAKPVMILQPPSAQSDIFHFRISPDSRWVAYVTDESGQHEMYITSFPEGKGKWRVSADGAGYPAWAKNGKELFFKDLTDVIWVSSITPKGSELDVGTPQRLFHASMPGVGVPYDVAADGRILVNVAEEESQAPLKFTSNWPVELRK